MSVAARVMSSSNGEGYVVRAAGRIERCLEIGEIVVATRGDTPLRVKDLAEVTIGRELRTGSASLNGHEAVLGTALMLIGGNSRTVAAAARQDQGDQQDAAARHSGARRC